MKTGGLRLTFGAWATLAAMAGAVLALYVFVTGVSVVWFDDGDVKGEYAQVCLQKSTPDKDELGDDAYNCDDGNGLHAGLGGRELYAFFNAGPPSDLVLICRDDRRKHVVHYGYLYGGAPSKVERIPVTCSDNSE